MENTTTQSQNQSNPRPANAGNSAGAPASRGGQTGGYRGAANRGGQQRGPGGSGNPRGERRTYADRPKPDVEQKIIDIRRVTRVVAGGRRFSFSVAIAVGDKKGGVGVGLGKAGDTALAIAKALKDAQKKMIYINVTKEMSIPHEISAKFEASKVIMLPNKGRGLVAGSSVRDILVLGGMKDINAKILSGSKNKLNNAKAAMKALAQVATTKKKPVVAVASVAGSNTVSLTPVTPAKTSVKASVKNPAKEETKNIAQ